MSRKPSSSALQPSMQLERARQAEEEAEASARMQARRPRPPRVRVEAPSDDLRLSMSLNTEERRIVRGYRLCMPETREQELSALAIEVQEERRQR